ncbi:MULTISPECIES: D-amino-acid transaminase [Bacillus]|jgi:D-alanine transaminase|uniref:D-alanine aminotransferase n=1 Tax=Bacillus amyloliquefaciens (strain ATCC 23350 / DSM 7 / BCRC 11601 / CCUG 28519 / NBRC 15535 / NRRL B-14393 / F) TaxID=692420 RepID=A0A9P1NGN3_BACAS|nr:D-amino-acid transaminase [Bacillus amyloliquefaciens]ARW38213.1 D-amino-acid transaminase [Bacillus amyloliquefaciens]AZV88514.1 D-alanine aminotransferase [Bacillus amyloliquefaciens]KYC92660.1 D-alanine aminotransferase [Bacillus amyloliquefaciens]MBW8279690.1 D-amino-acid transaminase [Bacillus amyloliquefaciens]MDR4375346.1 D-amino-acid transaminase [Bacillus amyloliquefaciens]
MKALVNGQLIDREEAAVDIEDRGYQFGDGVYEVIRVYNGALFGLREHIVRLFRSAAEIGIALPFSAEDIEWDLQKLVQENKLIDGGVYIQTTRGKAPRKHQYDKGLEPQTTAYTFSVKKPENEQKAGAQAITAEDKRWLRCDIKSLNLLYNVMIKQKAYEAGAYEAVLIRDGAVTEGTSSNVYAVINGTVRTHPANELILNGITRIKLLELMKENGIEVREKPLTEDELRGADEIFISSTTSELIPIVTLDGKPVGSGAPGPVAKTILEAFQSRIQQEIGVQS